MKFCEILKSQNRVLYMSTLVIAFRDEVGHPNFVTKSQLRLMRNFISRFTRFLWVICGYPQITQRKRCKLMWNFISFNLRVSYRGHIRTTKIFVRTAQKKRRKKSWKLYNVLWIFMKISWNFMKFHEILIKFLSNFAAKKMYALNVYAGDRY